MSSRSCRNCGTHSFEVFCDLGSQPLANRFLTKEQLDEVEPHYPLVPVVCMRCGLVQLPALATPEDILGQYAYRSSQSVDWQFHVFEFANKAVKQLGLDKDSRVLEVASNDGPLLTAFRELGIPAVGVEPARNLARIAQYSGLATIDSFMTADLGRELARDGFRADLVVADNVLAHVPDLDDFLRGIVLALAPTGVAVFEFPDLANLVQLNQFDTIYHEHFSYFDLVTATDALERRGLTVCAVDRIPTHGGSLRLWTRHGPQRWTNHRPHPDTLTYGGQPRSFRQRWQSTMLGYVDEGKRIVGYGAPAKGNTFLNYCSGGAFLAYVVDSTPEKQNTYLPGTRIPVYAPDMLDEMPPDVIVILPWNWAKEIHAKLGRHRKATVLSRLQAL